MALYKIITAEPTVADTEFSSLTASATNTIVTSVVCTDAATPTVQLLIKKSGGTSKPLAKATLVAGIPKELLTTSFALQAGDILYTESTTANSDFIISYAEDTVVSTGGVSGVTITTDSGAGAKAIDTAGSADFTLIGATGVGITNSGATITATAVPGEIDHDSLSNFLAAEHVDWAGASAGTIHASNYTDTDTVYNPATIQAEVDLNTAKTGISSGQASAITTNTAKVSYTDASAVTANTAKVGITSGQASAITANTAKTGITSGQASAITTNTAKTGITSGQTSAITANTAKVGITSGQASAITANTAKTGISSGQASAITANTAKTSFSNLTGEVTSSGATTTIAANIVDEANLKVSNAPTNGYFLSAQSGDTGGLTWAAAGGGSGDITSVVAGAGMTGGATSGDATVNVIGGDGITANADDIAVTAAQTAVTSMINASLTKIGTATDQEYVTFGTANEVNTFVNNTERLSVTASGADLTGALSVSGLISPAAGHLYAKGSATHYEAQGDIIKIGTGSTLRGEICYLTSSGTWVAADADAVATSGGVLLAMALGTDPDADGMLLRGMFTTDGIDGTEAVGDELYVSVTAGNITRDAPTGSGDIVRVVGYCFDPSDGQIWFNPSNDFIVLA